MVTHNPDLADKYATRIIRLLDGLVTSDSNPYSENELTVGAAIGRPQDSIADGGRAMRAPTKKRVKTKKISMSFFTALLLSLTNLMTKKTRTFLTAFAGSIGIIGIALILSLSDGMQNYISSVEEDTLSSYPISIGQRAMDITSMMNTMSDNAGHREPIENREENRVYSNNIMGRMVNLVMQELTANDLKSFREFIKSDEDKWKSLTNDIKYGYSTTMNIYKSDTSDGIVQVNPNTIFEVMGISEMMGGGGDITSSFGMAGGGMGGMGGMMSGNFDFFSELIDNDELLNAQYDVVAGRMPEKYDEVVLFVSRNNRLTDFILYSLGLLDPNDFSDILAKIAAGEEVENDIVSFSYDELLEIEFKLVLNTDYYEKSDGVWVDKRDDVDFMEQLIAGARTIKIVGILRASENAAIMGGGGGDGIGYRPDLMLTLIDAVNASQIVREQNADHNTDVFTGTPFASGTDERDVELDQELLSNFDPSTLSLSQMSKLAGMTEEEQREFILQLLKSPATYDENMRKLGVSDIESPGSIRIYPKDFASKDEIINIIENYNSDMENAGNEDKVIHYTDYVGLLMSSVSDIITTISYVLMAFVAISLVVSSIMIGIITYISVLERTKEIGILRSIGASKNDISRVFNAETLIMGFSAGALGIIVTLLLLIPGNIIIHAVTGIAGLAALPFVGGLILIAISMILTLIAGFIPSKIAAKKDPVVALRTE
jgi:putative ABC transport system permease protein